MVTGSNPVVVANKINSLFRHGQPLERVGHPLVTTGDPFLPSAFLYLSECVLKIRV
jgi:hypothetical protein